MDSEFWQWLFNNGLAVAIIAGMGIAMWRMASWLGVTFVTPMRDAAITHLKMVDTTLTTTVAALEATTAKLSAIEKNTGFLVPAVEECIEDRSQLHSEVEVIKQQLRGKPDHA